MAKTHYKKNDETLCGAKPFGPWPGDMLIITDGDIPDSLEFIQSPLPMTDDWAKVTCKRCLKKQPKEN